jgi:GNAT superfamily N-acetyltransferase
MITIQAYRPGDEDKIIGLILPIQTIEFGVDSPIESQPDLRAIDDFYVSGGGGFWVAREGGRIVGTIAMKVFGGDGDAALRKMFVAADRRGRDHGVGQRLLDTLLDHGRTIGLNRIMLGTTEAFVGAHRFYEKNGFVPIAKHDLPPAFPLVAVDTRFYALTL